MYEYAEFGFHSVFPRSHVLFPVYFAEVQFTPSSEVQSRSLDRNIPNWQANNAPSLGPCFQDLLVPLSWHADSIHDSIQRSYVYSRSSTSKGTCSFCSYLLCSQLAMWTIISYSFERLYTLWTFVWSYLRKLSFLNMISRYTNGNK